MLDAVKAADDLFPLRRAVDERNLFPEYQRVRMHVEGQHRGLGLQLGRALFHPLQQGRVPAVDTVKKAEGHGPFSLIHVCHTSKKLLIVRQVPPATLASARNSPLPPYRR